MKIKQVDAQGYRLINEALNLYFFDGRFDLLPVYLILEDEAYAELGLSLGVAPEKVSDLIGLYVGQSLCFDQADPYIDHIGWLKNWSDEGRKTPPPFTALLVAFSIAAERMGSDYSISPNNYYQRLFDLLDTHGATKQQKLKQYAKSTRQFWRALNLWLSENDFVFGRPTAKALINHWKYASYALSQALVREGDRRRFSRLFEAYDLVPRSFVSEAEMSLIVHDWMTSHGPNGPTNWLRKLWTANDLRDRVVGAAIDAFEVWDGESENVAPRSINARIRWQLGFIGFPRKKVRFSLVVSRGGQVEILRPDNASANFRTDLFLEKGSEPELLYLGPVSDIDLDLFLLRSCDFKGDKSGSTYSYVAKPIVVFARSPAGPGFIEVARVSLFEEHIVFCHEDWLEKVQGHLAHCSKANHRILRPQDIEGLPEGWCVLRGVEVIRSAANVHDNLYALNPIDNSTSIVCTHGLKLGHATWHLDAPPLIEAKAEKANSKLLVYSERFGEEAEVLKSAKSNRGYMCIDLSGLTFETAPELRAVVAAQSDEIGELSVSLRSADAPRPLGKKRLFLPVEIGKGFSLDVDAFERGKSISGLEGYFVHGEVSFLNEQHITSLFDDIENLPEGESEAPFEQDWQRSENAGQVVPESCVIRGYHHWVCEPFNRGDDRYEAKMAECKNCHVKTLSRSRAAAKRNRRNYCPETSRVTKITQRNLTEFVVPEIGSADNVGLSLDTVFDGLCYLGQGSWSSFLGFVSKASQDPWFPRSFANELSVLGCLELNDILEVNASMWSVPPPVLVTDSNRNVRLAGFYSHQLLLLLKDAFERLGAIYQPMLHAKQLTIHRWSNLNHSEVGAVLENIKDPYGRPVRLLQNSGRYIAANLPAIDALWSKGRSVHVETSESLTKFDLNSASWVKVDEVQCCEAYKVGLFGTRYLYCDATGALREVGYRTAKILTARSSGVRLHGYDPKSRNFFAALGADPPGLFARAIVASSGSLPKLERGRLIYENVEPFVAATVLSKMYQGAE